MKEINLLPFLLLFFLFLPTKEANKPVIASQEDFSEYIGYSSAITNDVSINDIKIEVIPVPLCGCNGTGFIMSGDGIQKIKCVCGDNCKCAKPDTANTKCNCGCGKTNCHCGKTSSVGCAEPNASFTYMFSASWCQPCKNWKKNELPKLKKVGWKESYDKWENDANIVIVDVDNNAEIWKKYGEFNEQGVGILPQFVVVRNGEKLGKGKIGPINYLELANFHNDLIKKAKGEK